MKYILICLLSILSCKAQDTPTQFSEAALNDTFVTLEGKTIAFKDILEANKGKTLVIDVWASWCKDCIGGMPKVKSLQKANKDATYLFLSLDKTQDAWKKGIKKYDVQGQHYFVESGWKGPFCEFIQLDWIPRYMVVDTNGNIKLFKAIEADDKKIKEIL
ncbi:TlpA disulfide reductase family protein [Mariniflexile litorale]|uniref:TlpA disulfide reductase family protein n=1 Tax=Mariniflexile litorale TaxID=3045158 RepID=A0AAU7EBL3_9FLAO|nr:TlpA disulfide reductase family protein [Mariniflexile sp. KMM 9835]MDQ8213002.1 TlpA disulfide reductase family protein [Mariniflexile sp. KMM 9835]